MKKLLIVLIGLTIFLAACGDGENVKTEAEPEGELPIEAQDLVEDESQLAVEEKDDIGDIEAVIEFINTTESNTTLDNEGNPLRIGEIYDAYYFDFTGEGNDDIALASFKDDDDYNPIMFVTCDIGNGKYTLINSDFRAARNEKEIFAQGQFIIQRDIENAMIDIAYFNGKDFISMADRYISYDDIEYQSYFADTVEAYRCERDQLDGYRHFVVNMRKVYRDQKGQEYPLKDKTMEYRFNEADMAYEIDERVNMEPVELWGIISEALEGEDSSLKSFGEVYGEKDYLEALSYYDANRLGFTKEARIEYILACGQEMYDMYEGGQMYYYQEAHGQQTFKEMHDNYPIPEKMASIYELGKVFYIEDGSAYRPFDIDEGEYSIVGTSPEATRILEAMEDDMNHVSEDGISFADTVNATMEFVSKDKMIEEMKQAPAYPVVVIRDFADTESFNHKAVWKTTIVLLPE